MRKVGLFQILLAASLLFLATSAVARADAPAVEGPAMVRAEAPAEAPHGLLDPELGTAFFTVIIFVALVIVLRATAWSPISKGLKDRENSIRDSIEAAAKAKADAERQTRELESKIAQAQAEGAKQLAQARADAQKLAEGIRAQAESEALALKDRTLREIAAAKQQALSEINQHVADLGTAIARKILQRNVTVDDQSRLVDESLQQLQGVNKN